MAQHAPFWRQAKEVVLGCDREAMQKLVWVDACPRGLLGAAAEELSQGAPSFSGCERRDTSREHAFP